MNSALAVARQSSLLLAFSRLVTQIGQMSTVTRRVITTADAPGAIGPYSQAVLVDKTLYISGCLGMEPSSGQVSGSVAQQAQQALKNMGAVLKAADGDYASVVKTTIFLVDMGDFAAVNDVYKSYFQPPFPARSCIAVARLPKDARVEIEAVAVMGDVQEEKK